jgi:hypothetical protein
MSDEGGQPVESYTIRRASPREDRGQRVYLSLPGPLNTLHDKDDRSNMLANHSRLIRSSRLQLATQWREALTLPHTSIVKKSSADQLRQLAVRVARRDRELGRHAMYDRQSNNINYPNMQ